VSDKVTRQYNDVAWIFLMENPEDLFVINYNSIRDWLLPRKHVDVSPAF